MTTTQKTLVQWHKVVEEKNISLLHELLAEDVVFHSPVVHTPQRGKTITLQYLSAAAMVLGGEKFSYAREIVMDKHCALEFTTEIDGILINGIDLIELNEEGKIVDFKVMVRPLKAIQKVHQKMAELLLRNESKIAGT